MWTPSTRDSKQARTSYVCMLAQTSLYGQTESRPDTEAGPKGIMVLAYRHIKRGLVLKLLKRAFSRHPWIPGILKFDSILSLFKCAPFSKKFASLTHFRLNSSLKHPKCAHYLEFFYVGFHKKLLLLEFECETWTNIFNNVFVIKTKKMFVRKAKCSLQIFQG